MRVVSIFLMVGLLAACSSFDDTPGQVQGVDDRGRLKITGPKQFGKDPAPSARMVEQAKEVCPFAVLISARPSTFDYDIYEYLFRC